MFPEVQSAYKPSGKIGFLTIPIMLLFGGVSSFVGGYLWVKLFIILGDWTATISSDQTRGYLGFILLVVLSVGLGVGVGLGVVLGGRVGKNRNKVVAIAVGAICGIAAFAVVVLISGYVSILTFCAIALIPPVFSATFFVEPTPFCEQHNRFMKKKEIHKPLNGDDAMNLLTSRDFDKILKLPSANRDDRYFYIIEIWYCEICMSGIISMTSYARGESDIVTHLVFSSLLDRFESEKILNSASHHHQRQQEMAPLIRQLCSAEAGIVLSAIKELRERGWLEDGSLQGTKLNEANLSGSDLSRANLQWVDLSGANLQDAKLSEANLQRASLIKANLQGIDLSGANLQRIFINEEEFAVVSMLRGAMMRDNSRYDGRFNLAGDIEQARTHGVDTNDPVAMAEWYMVSPEEYKHGQDWTRKKGLIRQMSGAKTKRILQILEELRACGGLEDGSLQGVELNEANLSGINLGGANLQGANLRKTNLQGTELSEANLEGTELEKANLQGADLNRVNLQRAKLEKANLQGADLNRANLQRANLRDANLTEANLRACKNITSRTVV